jgi:hypothetical protein
MWPWKQSSITVCPARDTGGGAGGRLVCDNQSKDGGAGGGSSNVYIVVTRKSRPLIRGRHVINSFLQATKCPFPGDH